MLFEFKFLAKEINLSDTQHLSLFVNWRTIFARLDEIKGAHSPSSALHLYKQVNKERGIKTQSQMYY